MKNNILLLLTLCLLGQFACKKSIVTLNDDENPPIEEEEQLPPITSEGANTFGCLINGEVWTPKGYIFPLDNFDVYYDRIYFNSGFIQMYNTGDNDSLATQYITISFKTVNNTTEIDSTVQSKIILDQFFPCIRYEEVIQSNVAISKLDTINNIIAGTFEFSVVTENENCIDTIYVTDGRFDAIYRY